MIKNILIDLDNTLIDFNECARHAIIEGFEKFGARYTDETFPTFLRENNKLWASHERGEIDRAYIRANRWNIIFEKLGIECDGPAMETFFEDYIAHSAYPVEYAYELLDYLKDKYNLYIVSNGFRAVQQSRLQKGDFRKYFKDVFVSEDAGAPKPSKEFFGYCFKKLGGASVDECILIGDSLTADILGGNDYGIKTVWFDRTGETPDGSKIPTYTVKKLEEIKKIL